MEGSFGVNCNGRIICGAGWDNSDNQIKNVFEFRNNNFVEIKSLTRIIMFIIVYPTCFRKSRRSSARDWLIRGRGRKNNGIS
jgi:hypothetical protein